MSSVIGIVSFLKIEFMNKVSGKKLILLAVQYKCAELKGELLSAKFDLSICFLIYLKIRVRDIN